MKPLIIITDIEANSEYYKEVKNLLKQNNFEIVIEPGPNNLEARLKTLKVKPTLIIFGESFSFEEYLDFNTLKENNILLKDVPLICLNTTHPKLNNDLTLFIDEPVSPEELIRISKAHLKISHISDHD